MSAHAKGDRVTSRAETERRHSRRIDVLKRIQGYVRPLDIPITLMNLSDDGFLMHSPVVYHTGEIHEFRFTVPERDPIVLSARVVHEIRATSRHRVSYVIGLEFVDRGSVACEQRIQSLIGCLQGPIASDG